MELRTVEERDTVVVRTTVSVEELPQALGDGYGEIMRYLGENGIEPAGAPFAMYHNMDMENLDVEMGLPVSVPVEGSGRVKPGKLPGGRAAVAVHVGPYDTLDRTYTKLGEYIQREGLETEPFMYEVYLSDPGEVAPEQLQTEVFFPVRDT